MLSEKNTQTRSSKLKSAVWSVKLKDFILVLHQMLHGIIVDFLLWNLMFFTHATIINNCDCWSSLFEKAIQIMKGYILIQWWQGILQNKMLKTEYWRMNKKNCSTASKLSSLCFGKFYRADVNISVSLKSYIERFIVSTHIKCL